LKGIPKNKNKKNLITNKFLILLIKIK